MENTYMFIRGAIGIKKGLGLDEIEFNLKDKTGLVALAGANGRGKTTFLELMSLYRTLASRKGALKHHFCLRDSRVEHKFIYEDDEYHLIWKIDSGSDRSEAFIIVNGQSIVNGKSSEYDKFINQKFGSQTLFYNSVFCAQGSGNLATMTTGKIKELFVEFLRIEKLAEHEKQCKSGVAYYQKRLDKISGIISHEIYEIDEIGNVGFELVKNESAIAEEELEFENFNKDIKLLDKTIKELATKSEKQKAEVARKAELETELKKLEHDKDQILEKIKLGSDNFDDRKALLKKDLNQVESTLEDREKIFNAASKINNLKTWEKYFADCFECSMVEQGRIDSDIKEAEDEKRDLETKIKTLKDDLILDGIKTTLRYLENKIFNIESNRSVLKTKLKTAQNDFSLIQASKDVAACKEKIALAIDPDCKSTICPALEIVANAKKELPELEKKEADIKAGNQKTIEGFEKAIKICVENLADVESKSRHVLMDYDSVSKRITTDILISTKKYEAAEKTRKRLLSDYLTIDSFKGFYKTRLSDIRLAVDSLKILSSKKSLIEIAEEKKTSLSGQIKQLESDHSYRENELKADLSKASNSIFMKDGVIAKIEADIDEKIGDKISNIETKKDIILGKKSTISDKIEYLKSAAAVLKSDKARKDSLSKDLEAKQSEKQILEKELSEWDYLRLACSKTGLQALEIDGAAPLITSEANTLLEKAFGMESQIKIITQDPESGREVFWIKVIREDGSEDDFSNLSGGQKVWISHALSLGMTLVSKRKSGREFKTLFMDESDGALDKGKAVDFIRLYRAMLNTGDFETCLFISHNPELVAMADHEIDFDAL